MNTLKWFDLSEFDSPDRPGSGELMEEQLLQRLDLARDIYGLPMVVTSGFRTVDHHRHLKERGYPAAENSSHLLGWAVDIACIDPRARFEMVCAFVEAGFNRIGIGETFIHVDCDPEKPSDVCWIY